MKPAARRSALLFGCCALLLGGCISVGVGNSDGDVQAQYRLNDLGPPPGRAGKTVARSLVIAAMPSLGIGDTFSMAYSRAPQQRALYQYASWADRPSNRVVQLLVRRIDARGAFASVAELGSGVAGDLALNITVDELVHDTASARGRLHLTAELVDRTTRTLVARRRFEAAAPVAQENARAAVAALSRALTNVLDELVPWLESAAEKLPATASR
ncbi:MAG TPA: ABC-type transport auxiliary lipoprotein family protein [Burkholderiaceae bacterium]|nr:ABC-type transport auxiliary lipoprotein family protein [Burkholderiaceae bacterium]